MQRHRAKTMEPQSNGNLLIIYGFKFLLLEFEQTEAMILDVYAIFQMTLKNEQTLFRFTAKWQMETFRQMISNSRHPMIAFSDACPKWSRPNISEMAAVFAGGEAKL